MLKSVKKLFASPLLTFVYPEHEKLNQTLLSEISVIRKASSGMRRSNQHGWHSDTDFFKRPEPGCRALASFIIQAVSTAEANLAGEALSGSEKMRAEGWINVNRQGAFNTPHNHTGYEWSGSYYVYQPPVSDGRSGMIEFLDPRAGVSGWPGRKVDWRSAKFTLRPSAGTLLIFPSYLVHWVYPNDQDAERVSIAFNARFQTTKAATEPAAADARLTETA